MTETAARPFGDHVPSQVPGRRGGRRAGGRRAAASGLAGRLALLTGAVVGFLAVLAVLLLQKGLQDRAAATAHALEALRDASSRLAARMDADLAGRTPTAADLEMFLEGSGLGPRAAVGVLAADGAALAAAGRIETLPAQTGAGAPGPPYSAGSGAARFDGALIASAWRPIAGGRLLLVAAAPTRDLAPAGAYAPAGYGLIFVAVAALAGGLAIALARQLLAAENLRRETADARAQLRDAVTYGRCGLWSYTPATGAFRVSASLLRILGFEADSAELSLYGLARRIHPLDRHAAFHPQARGEDGVFETKLRIAQADGRWAWLHVRGGLIGETGEARGVAFEISREKQAEARLAAAEDRLRDAIESISEAFVLWDRRGRLVMWNRKFQEVYKLPPGVLTEGARFSDVVSAAGSSAPLLERFAGPLAAPGADAEGHAAEAALPDGRWAHISRRPTSDGGAVSVATDVTELKRQERARRSNEIQLKQTVEDLERSRAELREAVAKYEREKIRAEDASRSKSEFLAGMSHELRTPLNAINGFSEIMRSELYGPLGDEKYKGYVSDILDSGQHLLELIEDILDMSKIEAGKMQLDFSKVELKRVLGECLRLLQRTATDAEVGLTSSVGHIPPIWADARAVKQILLNILTNAIKFTPAGGGVSVRADADLDSVSIAVEDTGVGIAAEDLHRLGVAFEQIESQQSRRHKGSGLGLALSKSLMEMQRGVIAIASRPGEGTCVTLTFPRRPDSRIRARSLRGAQTHLLTQDPDAGEPPFAAE